MKVLVKVFGALVALWVVLLLVGFFLPGHYRVERSLVLAARPERIYAQVGDLRAWSRWGVWFERDPAMKITYSQATDQVGSWSSWVSREPGRRQDDRVSHPPA